MMRWISCILVVFIIGFWGASACAGNPFTSKPATAEKGALPPAPLFKSPWIVKLTLWQHQLRQAMSDLIRSAKSGGGMRPLLIAMGLSLAYGAVHAAGPGHGKFVAATYVLSHHVSVLRGMAFGAAIAAVHGFSGIVGVVALRLLLERGAGETLSSTTAVTQVVSYALIALLGVGIFVQHGLSFIRRQPRDSQEDESDSPDRGFIYWALAVGLVPCPAVVLVMLFCMSMDAMMLGFVLALCILTGMAVTISVVVVGVILGKTGVMKSIPSRRAQVIEGVLGLVSGAAVAFFGSMLLITAIQAGWY